MGALIRNLPLVLFTLAVAVLAAIVIQVAVTLPPQTFTILTGQPGGGYYLAAQEYQRIARENGFDLQIRTTNGAAEVLELLQSGAGDVGFVEGGIAGRGDPDVVNTIANVFYEPLWIFYRTDAFAGEPMTRLRQAEGKRVAIGPEGSGTRELALTLGARAGLTPQNTTMLNLSFDEAAAQLSAGTIDVAFFVVSDTSDLPWQLIRTPGIELMNVARAGAYAFYYPWLTELILPAAGADVERNIPAEPKRLLATTAHLVARNDLHPDLLRLLVVAAVETHRDGGKFEKPNEFPNLDLTELPASNDARVYMQQILRGQSMLDNYLPFWLASVIDRYLLFVVPVLLILLPFLSRSPQAFQWYMRQRVVRWYRIVHDVERRAQTLSLDEVDAELRHLEDLEERIGNELIVTNTYMPQVYELRQHIEFVMEKLRKRRRVLQAASPDGASTERQNGSPASVEISVVQQ